MYQSLRGLGLLLLTACLGLGCSDSMLSGETSSPEVTTSKFRNAHLLGQQENVAGKDDSEVGLLFSVSPNSLLERYAILDRYALVERYGILERYSFLDVFTGFSITVNASELDTLVAEMEADPDIEWIEPDFRVRGPVAKSLLDPDGQMLPPTLVQVGAHRSYARSGDGRGTVDADIYILDTGVSHPDINVVQSRNFSDDPTAEDVDGHGTHIAGIAAAIDDSDGIVGMAPGARVHNFKVFGSSGQADASTVIAAIEAAIQDMRANPDMEAVINLSLGEDVSTEEMTALDQAAQAAIDAGFAVVAAAGNHGGQVATITPAHLPGIITVGSGFFGMDSFSGRGPLVDIVAPGLIVTSLAPNAPGVYLMDGSSMSAAHVTGAVALYFGKRGTQTAAEAEQYLMENAKTAVLGLRGGTPNRVLNVKGLR